MHAFRLASFTTLLASSLILATPAAAQTSVQTANRRSIEIREQAMQRNS